LKENKGYGGLKLRRCAGSMQKSDKNRQGGKRGGNQGSTLGREKKRRIVIRHQQQKPRRGGKGNGQHQKLKK